MGRFSYWMNVSLDLRIEHATGEAGGGNWMRIDEALHREFNERARASAMMVHGRTIYEIMDPFWPNAADDPSQPEVMREFGRIWTAAPKVLVSRTRSEAGHNTRVIGGDDALDRLAELRRTTEGVLDVGGATLATQLLRRGLLDELVLYVHPVVLGAGRPLFDDLSEPVQCDLLEHRAFEGGVTLQRYAIRGAVP